MGFRKGESGNPRGRKPGTPNRVTRSFKEAMLAAFADLGGAAHLLAWAKKHPGEFYRIFARMTPPGFPVKLEGFGGTPAEQGRAVIGRLGAGEITPEQASTIMHAVSAQARIIEIDELERRLKALEERSEFLADAPGGPR